MATARKKWPNTAEYARLDSIAAAQKGLKALEPLIKTNPVAQMADVLHTIIRELSAVGATAGTPPTGQSPA